MELVDAQPKPIREKTAERWWEIVRIFCGRDDCELPMVNDDGVGWHAAVLQGGQGVEFVSPLYRDSVQTQISLNQQHFVIGIAT